VIKELERILGEAVVAYYQALSMQIRGSGGETRKTSVRIFRVPAEIRT
jgi:hypothetical protein